MYYQNGNKTNLFNSHNFIGLLDIITETYIYSNGLIT